MEATNRTSIAKPLGIVILVVLAYMAVHPMVAAMIGAATHAYAPVKIWKDVMLAVVTLGLVGYSLYRTRLRASVWNDALTWLIVAYSALVFVLFFARGLYHDEAGVAGIIFDLRFFAAFLSLRIALEIWNQRNASKSRVELEKVTRWIVYFGLGVAAFAILQVTVLPVEFMKSLGYDGVNTIAPVSTVDDNLAMRRAFSTMRGPNELGSYLILPISIALAYILAHRRRRMMAGALVLMVIAVYLSHSRSAFIGVGIACAATLLLWLGRDISTKLKLISAATVVAATLLIFVAAVNIPYLRMAVFHSSPSDSSLFEGSTSDHFVATAEGIQDALSNPLGRGPGEAGPASFYQTDEPPRIAENYYVQIAQELGLLGLALFVAICTVVVRRLYRLTKVTAVRSVSVAVVGAFAGVSAVALLLHTWNDDPTSYTWWIFAAILILYYSQHERKGNHGPATTHKKAKRAA